MPEGPAKRPTPTATDARKTVPSGITNPVAPRHDGPTESLPPARIGEACTAPTRIMIVSDAWEPQVNGVVRSYQNIIRALRQQDCTVRVIGPADFATLPVPGYSAVPLAILPYRRLAAMIDAFAPQAVHIAVEGPLGWAARRYCLRRGLPFSTSFHTNFPAYAALRTPWWLGGPKLLGGPVARLTTALARRFHARAHHTFVTTPSMEALLRDWGFAGQLVPLSRGVDCDVFAPVVAAPTPGNAPPTLLYVGRVAPEKDIAAFLRLTEEQTGPVRKVVVGDGPQRAALSRAYPDVDFRGTLTGAALAEAYRRADCFVFPSRTDTFGIVLIEAMASGLPIAAHDVPGPRDIVTVPMLGAIDSDLGRAVRHALRAPGSRAARHAHARAHYSWDSVAESFLHHSKEMQP
ncbi:glycosyltransferase family 4 protein [Roseicitreum antarcticum]|nr:glycosyltransferase family 1 protein [Roseicitreum antarcticum]